MTSGEVFISEVNRYLKSRRSTPFVNTASVVLRMQKERIEKYDDLLSATPSFGISEFVRGISNFGRVSYPEELGELLIFVEGLKIRLTSS